MDGVENITAIWKNGGGYAELERRADGQPFEYWIGMFTPANTPMPERFSYINFSAAVLELWEDENGGVWSFENCTCPRYTTPDERGNIIMDYCYFVK